MDTIQLDLRVRDKSLNTTGNVLKYECSEPEKVTLPMAITALKIIGKYSEQDQKLFAVLLHNAFDSLGKQEQFSIFSKDLEELYKDVTKKSPKDWVWRSSQNLLSSRVVWKVVDENGKEYRNAVPLLVFASQRTDGDILTYEFSKHLVPILKAPFRFGRVKTHLLLKLSGSYTLLTYQILEAFTRDGFLDVSLDDFKEWLSIPEDKYTDFRAFRRRVLDPAIKQINENSMEIGFVVRADQVKQKRKVVGLNFFMLKSQKRINHEKIIEGKASQTVGNFSEYIYEKAKQLAPRHDPKVLEKEYIEWIKRKGTKTKSLVGGYLKFVEKRGSRYGRR